MSERVQRVVAIIFHGIECGRDGVRAARVVRVIEPIRGGRRGEGGNRDA